MTKFCIQTRPMKIYVNFRFQDGVFLSRSIRLPQISQGYEKCHRILLLPIKIEDCRSHLPKSISSVNPYSSFNSLLLSHAFLHKELCFFLVSMETLLLATSMHRKRFYSNMFDTLGLCTPVLNMKKI